MHKLLLILALIFAPIYSLGGEWQKLDAIPENTKSVSVVIPIFSERLKFRLPIDWKAAFRDQKEDFFLIEFIPKNESIDDWGTILSVQGFKNLSDRVTAEQFLNLLVSGFQKTCPKSLIFTKLGSINVDNHDGVTAILGCTQIPAADKAGVKKENTEVGYYFVIQGKRDIYIIHKSIRSDNFSLANPPIKVSTAKQYISDISPIQVCKNEGHKAECIK